MKAVGVQVYEMSSEDIKAMVSMCESVQLQWAQERNLEAWFTRIKSIIQAAE